MMTAAQKDGRACVRCGGETGSMVPIGVLDGVQLFAHPTVRGVASECAPAALDPTIAPVLALELRENGRIGIRVLLAPSGEAAMLIATVRGREPHPEDLARWHGAKGTPRGVVPILFPAPEREIPIPINVGRIADTFAELGALVEAELEDRRRPR